VERARGGIASWRWVGGLQRIFQVLFYAVYIYLFVTVLLNWLGLVEGLDVHVSIGEAAKTVFVYLGIPFLAGLTTRLVLLRAKGRDWYERVFVPRISPVTWWRCCSRSSSCSRSRARSSSRCRSTSFGVAVPARIYFVIMWFAAFWLARRAGGDYRQTTAVSFTAASNDFELAIAVAVSIFGISSNQPSQP